MTEITQIGEQQSFFLPNSFTGTSQEAQRMSVILEDKLLKLVPVDLNRLQIKQEVSGPKPNISSSYISRLSLRRMSKRESQIINDETFTEQLKEVTKDPFGAGIAQFLINEALIRIDEAVKATNKDSESQIKRYHAQSELDLASDDQDSAYMREIKRLLISDCESDERGGKLIAIQGLRDAEEIVNSMLSALYQKKSSDANTGIGHFKLDKVVILASQNKRLEQIQDTIEYQFIKGAFETTFKLVKSHVSKAQKQKNQRKEQEYQESFRTIFDINQVFVLLDRKFQSYLIQGELDISEVDYLIFDEAHNIYPEATYVDLMNKFIFNHSLMLSPAKNPDLIEQNKRLPKVLAFFSLDSVLQAAQNNNSQIMKKFYFMANTFNASLLCLNKLDLLKVERDIMSEFRQSRVQKIQDISNLRQQVQNSQGFLQQVRKYLMFRRDGKTGVTCFPQSIIEKKKLHSYLYLQTKFAKITLDEAMYILQEFGTKLLEYHYNQFKDKQNMLYKPNIESAQWVNNKVRYFSSRMQFDENLMLLLGKDNVNQSALQIAIPSQNDKSGSKISWLYSPRIYLKKTQSESQAAFEMCKILQNQGYLDQQFRPMIIRLSKQLQIDSYSNISDHSKSTMCTTDKSEHEEEKTFLSIPSQQTKDPSEYNQVETQKIKPRAFRINWMHNQLKEEANEYFFRKQTKNRQKLDAGLEKGQHHIPIMHYNTSQLKLFINTILNPILKALNEYNELCDDQSNSDLIRFDNINVHMISESSIKEQLFQHCFNEKQGTIKVNQTFIQFKNYRQRMFNIYDKKNELRYAQQYPDLVKMIDQSLERYKFPHYMTQHVQNYHSLVRGKTSKIQPQVQEDFNRKTFLTMLMIALSDKEPTTMEFEKVKNEMGRLAFVGDSVIILCQVITMIFSGNKSFSEKDLDAVKNQTVKTENLKQRAQQVGLDFLKIKAKYYQKTDPNRQVEAEQKPRDLGDVIKSLAGLFSIYLGMGATYLLLSDFGIVEPPTNDLFIKIGKISVAQKVQILRKISQNRKDLLDYKQDQKMQIFNILCKQQYPGFNKEPLTGTEILEVWKKLVKSRGLFMKHDLKNIFPKQEITESKEDGSPSQLTDLSISQSYYTPSSGSLVETVTCSTTQQIEPSDIPSLQGTFDEYKATIIEEEKIELPQDNASITQDILLHIEPSFIDDSQSVSTSLRYKCSKYSDDSTTVGDQEQSKSGGEVIDEDIVEEIVEPNQSQVEIFERGYKELIQEGYEFKNLEILLQSIVHKSQSEKLQNLDTTFKDSYSIEKEIIMQYNLQILEYLGDSILNFTISKLFYCETADNQKQWHGDFFVPTKLHELKTWFSSNNWLSFALFENYYCTITEEIPRDAQFQKGIFAKKAQETIKQLKMNQISEKQAIELAPRVSLIYDQNDKFEEQINDFNGSCFKQCLAADINKAAKIKNYPIEGFKVTSKSLSLKIFKDKDIQQQDQDEVDFSEIDEKFVKYFSDVMEALIGAIFMDSGDLDKTQMILVKLINCPSVQSFPIVQHDRTAVLSVFNSKPYCKGIKLYHTMEEKDGYIYIMGYMGKLQFRRLKYSKERKKKVQLFYYDMRLYLEDAYKEFEIQFVQKRATSLFLENTNKGIDMKYVQKIKEIEKREPANEDVDHDNIKGNTPTNDEWLEFNKDYRKTWKQKVLSGSDPKRYSAIKEAAKLLYKFVSSAQENFKTRENQNVHEMRDQIINYLNIGLQTININLKNSLLVLESERVQSSRIRELLHSSDIKFIDCLSYNMRDVRNFIDKLNNRQVYQFYEHLIEFGKN